MRAVVYKNLNMMRILLNAGANVNIPGKRGKTALMWGAETKNLRVVRMLLKAGADPFAQIDINPKEPLESVRWTALEFACKKKTLLELLKGEMRRRIAAALSVMPAQVPMHVKQDILKLAYSWKPS